MRLKLSPRAARLVAGPAMKVLAASWRMEVHHEERWRQIYQARRAHVYLLWHEALLPLLWQHRGQGVAIVVSEARDGQYLADFGFPQTLIEHWNGSTWSIVPSPNAGDGGELKAVAAVSASDVWAVGNSLGPGNGVKKTLVEHWDGSAWSVVPSPSPDMFTDDSLLSVAARSSQEVWAVGLSPVVDELELLKAAA